MGLFDNLFLDQNTPVTINDGNDHSHDVTSVIIDEIPPSVPPEKVESEKSSPSVEPKDTTLVDLFDADKKDENDAKAIMTPEPEKDIALEIGQGPAGGLPKADDAVSFDIGGDISFDIGGDIGGISFDQESATPMPSTSEVPTDTISVPSTGLDLEVGMPVITDNPGISMIDEPTVPTISESSVSVISPSTSENNPLFSLLNDGVGASGDVTLIGTSSTPSVVDSGEQAGVAPAISPQIGGGLFDLVGQSEAGKEISNSSQVGGEAVSIAPIQSPNSSIFGSTFSPVEPVVSIGNTPSIGGGEPQAIDVSSQNISGDASVHHTLSGSIGSINPPKLRAKISQFLSELDSLEIGDQTDREHKVEQIEMCKMRIREIQAESERRIDALRHEIQELEHEIETMDHEKNRIKNVIQSFQKELDAV